jgi:hypothetical protein
VRKAVRDLRDLKKPLDEFRGKTATMKAAAVLPPYDKSDYAAGLRRELREAARAMSSGQRAGKLAGSGRSLAFIDAVLEQEPWVSGIDIFNPNEVQVYEGAREARLRDLRGPLLDTVAERENTLQEVEMIVAVARGDIQHVSNLAGPDFDRIAVPIETRAGEPWILSDGKTICEVLPNGEAAYHPASEDELRDGREFPDLASYLASRAA